MTIEVEEIDSAADESAESVDYLSGDMSAETLALIGDAPSESTPEPEGEPQETEAEPAEEEEAAAEAKDSTESEPEASLGSAYEEFTKAVQATEAKRQESDDKKAVARSQTRIDSWKEKFSTDQTGTLREFLSEVAGDKADAAKEELYRALTAELLGTDPISGAQPISEAARLQRQLKERDDELAELRRNQEESAKQAEAARANQAAIAELAPVLEAQKETYPHLFKGVAAYHAMGMYLDDTPASVVLQIARENGVSFEDAASHVNQELSTKVEALTSLSATSGQTQYKASQGSQGDTGKRTPESPTLTNQDAARVPDGRSHYDYLEDEDASIERALSMLPGG